MKVRRRIVLVEASVKGGLTEDERTFIQSITANNLGEVLSISDNGFTLQFGARKTRESDIERSLLVCTAIREHIEGVRFGLSYGLVSVTEKKCGTLLIEGPLKRKVKTLNKIAAWGQISVDNSIIKIYSRIVDIRHVKYKGKDVYNVFGFKETPSRIRGLREAYTKLIGRDKEFTFLQELIYQIAADQGQIVGVVGEAGIGKTRFTHELKTLLKMRGLKFYEGAFPYFGGSAYKGFKDIISEIANIQVDDSLPRFEKKLRMTCKKYDLEDADVNFLINLYTLEPVSETLKHLNEEQIRLGTFVAIKKLIFNIAEHPLIIILEDMQNADELSAKLSDFIAEGLPNKKLLFFMNYRPEYHGECEKKIYFNEIKLKRFDEAKAKEFLKSLLDLSFIPKQIVRTILKKSAGNPLYIEELVRSLLDKGKIEVVNNEIKLKDRIETGDIQPTIHGVISYRMEKLPKEIRKTLQWASCIGDSIDIKLLKTILERDISKDIEELEIRDFIVERSIYPEEIYRFRHDLIREVAYESLSSTMKKRIHLKIANYLEKKFKREIDENSEVLAHHYTESSDYKKGFHYAYKAAQILKENYANEKAIDLFQKAYDLVDKAKIKDKRKTKMQILEWMKDVFVVSSQYKKAFSLMLKYEKHIKKENDLETLALNRMIGEIYFYQGSFSKALIILKKNLEKGLKEKRKIEIIKTLILLISINTSLQNTKESEKYSIQALNLIEHKETIEKASILNKLGLAYIYSGRHQEAIDYLEQSTRIFNDFNELDKLVSSTLNLANAYFVKANFQRAYHFWTRALNIAKEIGNISHIGIIRQNLGVLFINMGKIQDSLKEYNYAKTILNQIDFYSGQNMVYSNLAFTYQLLGDLKKAKKYLKQSLHYGEKTRSKFWFAHNLLIESKIEYELKNYKKAEALAKHSLKEFKKMGYQNKCIELVKELSQIYYRTNNSQKYLFLKNEIKDIKKSGVTQEGYEYLLMTKMLIELTINKQIKLPKYDKILSNTTVLFYENKFDMFSLLAEYNKKVMHNEKKSQEYALKAFAVYKNYHSNVKDDLKKEIEAKRSFVEFFEEYNINI